MSIFSNNSRIKIKNRAVYCVKDDSRFRNAKHRKLPKYKDKVCCQLTGSSDFTLKSLLPLNWQQRFYDEMAAAS